MSTQRRRRDGATSETYTTITTAIPKIKKEEKVGQYSMETDMVAEIMGTKNPTSGKKNKIH